MIKEAANLFRALDRELWIITAHANNESSGLVSTSVSQASIDEQTPRLTVGLAIHHYTEKLIQSSGCFVAHLISAEQSDWIRHFGTQTGSQIDKFASLETFPSQTHTPILKHARAWLECRVENMMETGDRHWYLAEIVDSHWTDGFQPLTFQGFISQTDEDTRSLLKKQLEEDSLTDRHLVSDWRRSRRSGDR